MQNKSPNQLIGLMTDRSPNVLAGILGILKSGNGFVPIDPTYPEERIRFIVEDCQLEILVTEEKHLAKAQSAAAQNACLQNVICLDQLQSTPEPSSNAHSSTNGERANSSKPPIVFDAVDLALQPKAEPDTTVGPDNYAYAIYTSGSTGTPKGVLITHRNLSPLLFWTLDYFGINEQTKVLQNLNYCFDFGVFELVTTLICGGTLHFLERHDLTDFAEYAAYINDQAINTFHTTPSFVMNMLPFAKRFDSLKVLHLGGEAVTDKMVDEIFTRVSSHCRLYNGYGPTEVSVNSSIFDVGTPNTWDRQYANIPIGQVSANNHLYVLDQHLDPVAIGMPGELFIGGTGVAEGYLNRPDVTAERFIPSPFSKSPKERLYRTGDLVRYLPDGNIEFLGRIDNQVKLRGFRIELGEIESALRRHLSIRDTIVLVYRDEDRVSDGQLVAYLTAEAADRPVHNELRSLLLETLPEYMVPAAFVWLEELPLTSNGKVDRSALPAPDQLRPEMAVDFVEPETADEKALAAVFQQVLQIDTVGIYDNFFALGGDSILSIQVVARAEQAGISVTPSQLFHNPSIAGLLSVAGEQTIIASEQSSVTGEAPLTPIQHWFINQEFPDPHHWNWSYFYEVVQPLDPALLRQTVHHLAQQHDILRLRLHLEGADKFQTYDANIDGSPDDAAFFTVIDLSSEPDSALPVAIEQAAAKIQTSLSLAGGPMARVAYFDCGAARNARLLITFHHLVVDAVSIRLLSDDFNTVYTQLATQAPVELPPKTSSYKEWSHSLARFAQSDVVRNELAYWRDTIGTYDAPPLPVDFSDGDHSFSNQEAVLVSLDESETEALLRQTLTAFDAQIDDLLFTALVKSFNQWTGQRKLLVATEGHGRYEEILGDVNVSRTVGWFTSGYSILLDLKESNTTADAVATIKEQVRALPNRGIGYWLLRYMSKDDSIRAQMEEWPEAQVSFAYMGQFDRGFTQIGAFQRAKEEQGATRNQDAPNPFQIYIITEVQDRKLYLNIRFGKSQYKTETMETLAQGFLTELRGLIEKARGGVAELELA